MTFSNRKPRITLSKAYSSHGYRWVCANHLAFGLGHSPKGAYEEWNKTRLDSR